MNKDFCHVVLMYFIVFSVMFRDKPSLAGGGVVMYQRLPSMQSFVKSH